MELDQSTTVADQPVPDEAGSRLPRRSNNDRYLGGVAGGIAERFSIDQFVVRAAFLGSTLFAAYAADWIPVLPVAYTVLWLFLPSPAGRSVARRIRTPAGRREAVAAVASCVVIGILLTRPVFGFALALAAVAWVLLADEPTGGRTPMAATGSALSSSANVTVDPDASPSADVDTRLSESVDQPAATGSRWGRHRRFERGETLVSPFTNLATRTRRRPALWPLTLSLLAILAIGGAMVDSFIEPGVDPAVLVNSALIIVGGVLVLSAWKGRALWTAIIAVALLPAWIGFSVADVGRFDGYGTVTYTPTEIPASGTLDYANGYGSMTVDLRQLEFTPGEQVSLNVRSTAGTVTVIAPPEVDALLRAKIGLGTTSVRGNGVDYYEYDREPFMDRSMIRRYLAHGKGCIDDYWSTWSLLIATHTEAGVDLAGLSADEADDVDTILATIVATGFDEPIRVDDQPQQEDFYQDPSFTNAVDGSYRLIDDAGNEYFVDSDALPLDVQDQIRSAQEPFQQAVPDRTWSYSANFDGSPCFAIPAPTNPATIEIDATIGIGTLEVQRDQI